MLSRQELNRKVVLGALWNQGAFLLGKLVVFGTTVVLARLLDADDFGLVAIGLTVLAVLETVSEGGTGAAVVWRRQDPEQTAGAAMTIGLCGGILIAALTFLAAPAIALFFNDPRVTEIVRVLSVCFLLASPASVFAGLLQRQLAFRKRVIPEVLKAVAKGAVGITLAMLDFGAWSLVYGHIAGLAVGLGLLWWLSGWRPRLSFDRTVLLDISSYGVQIVLLGLLGMVVKNIDYLIVGHMFDAASLGVYVLAFTLIDQIIMGICWAASQALFPTYGLLQSDPRALRRTFGDSLSGIAALTLPAAAGLALVAEPFVQSFYGEKWLSVIPVMQVMALYAMIYSIGFNLGDLYKAIGRPGILTRISMLNVVLAVPVLTMSAGWGIIGVAAGQVCVATIITLVNWIVAYRMIGIGPDVFAKALKGPLTATLLMTAVIFGVDEALQLQNPHERLALLIGVGIVSYALALSVSAPRLSAAVMAWVLPRRQTSLPPARLP